jgi:hypothetical protein
LSTGPTGSEVGVGVGGGVGVKVGVGCLVPSSSGFVGSGVDVGGGVGVNVGGGVGVEVGLGVGVGGGGTGVLVGRICMTNVSVGATFISGVKVAVEASLEVGVIAPEPHATTRNNNTAS